MSKLGVSVIKGWNKHSVLGCLHENHLVETVSKLGVSVIKGWNKHSVLGCLHKNHLVETVLLQVLIVIQDVP